MFNQTNKEILQELKTLNLRLEFLTMALLSINGEKPQDLNSTQNNEDAIKKKNDKDFEYMDVNSSIEEDIKQNREQQLKTEEKDFFEYNDDSGIGLREDLIEAESD